MHSTCVARPFASVLLPPLPTRCSATARAHPVATRVRRRAGEIGLRCGVAALVAAGLTFLQPISLAHAEPAPLLVGIPRVVDGDTLEVAGERVRFFGMDAPESKQLCTTSGGEEYLCGKKAAEALEGRVGGKTVECTVKSTDMYGRRVAVCAVHSAPGVAQDDVNEWMVRNGWAVAYRAYSKQYVPAEDSAREAGRGIWSGSFQEPAAWRRDHKRGGTTGVPSPPATVVAAAPASHAPGCDIKGNINSKGERIYHMPGGEYYAATQIDVGSDERWFCDEAEAMAAGWRKARG